MARGTFARKRSQDELEASLRRQIGHLRRSQILYEQGVWEEAERLAAIAYILLHDGRPPVKGLLETIGLRSGIQFPSTRTLSVVYCRLPICQVKEDGKSWRYFPIYNGDGVPGYKVDLLSFSSWWHEVIYERGAATLSRSMLVQTLRSQDGGAHVDEEITAEAYDLLATLANDEIHILNGKPVVSRIGHFGLSPSELAARRARPPYIGNPPIAGGHWAAMRQISWELDQALQSVGY